MSPVGFPDPGFKIVAEAVAQYMRTAHRTDCDWHLVESSMEVRAPQFQEVYGLGSSGRGRELVQTQAGLINLHLDLVGTQPSQELPITDDTLVGQVTELERKLAQEKVQREKAERKLAKFEDDEERLIRRVTAKTRAMHGSQEGTMNRPDCDNHKPQTTGFPWERPDCWTTWCPECGALEAGSQFVGVAKPDPDGGPSDWLYQPAVPLNWINVSVKLVNPSSGFDMRGTKTGRIQSAVPNKSNGPKDQ